MKKYNLKQAIKPITGIIAIVLLSLSSLSSFGQTWVTPTHARNLLGTIGSDPRINCANMTYDPGAPGTTGQLSAICWDKSNTPYASGPGFVVMDGKGNTHVETHPSTFTNATKLDVIVGNAIITNGGQGYRVGVVYLNTTTGAIDLDVYDVLNIGSPLLTTNFVTTVTIASAAAGQNNDPHIDIIAEYADTHILGLPYCSKYVVTYSNISSGTSNIEGYQGDLNFGPTNSITIASVSIPGILRTPDVAGIQVNSLGGPQNYARFAFVDENYNIKEAEWNISTSSIAVAPAVVMTAPHAMYPDAYAYYFPRIDAIDNYLTSMTSGQANYQIVGNLVYLQFVFSGTPPAWHTAYSYYIKGYNNNAGLISFSSPYMDAYENVTPCVAAGPINEYTICYLTDHPNPSGVGGFDIAQNVDFSTGHLSSGNLYQIDSFAQATADTGGYAHTPLCISTSFNDTRYNLVAWCNNLTDFFFKFTGNPIVFKQANGATTMEENISVSPNPASNHINVSGAADRYELTDMQGRSLLSGALPGNKQIDINGIATGMYILKLYQQDKNVLTYKIIKQ